MGASHPIEETLELVANQLTAAVTRCDRDLRYVWASRGYAAWIERPLTAVIGRPIEEVLGTAAYLALLPHFTRVLTGETVTYEQEVPFQGIGLRKISAVYSPTRDPHDEVDGWVAVVVDVTDRKRLEAQLVDSQLRLAAKADALVRLNQWTARLRGALDLQRGLEEMLSAVMALTGADKGNVQLFDPTRAVLTITAQTGFDQAFLDYFREVSAVDESACGRALASGVQVVIEDVEADRRFASLRAIASASGFRAVISTPMISADEQPIGMLSTHFASVHRPTADALQMLELYAHQAASFIRQCLAEQRIRESDEQLHRVNAQLEDRIRERTSEVHTLLGRLIAAQDNERHRIALDIHDHLGQQMTALRMHLAVLIERASTDAALVDQAARTQKIAEMLDDSIDAITSELRPAALDDLGLCAALRDLIAKWYERFGVTAELSVCDDDLHLSRDEEAHLYSVTQEALHNVGKHAHATQVRVTIESRAGQMALSVVDNGLSQKSMRHTFSDLVYHQH